MSEYGAIINYTVDGYAGGREGKGAYFFYCFADSYGEAFEKAFENFEAFRRFRTRKGGVDYGLQFTLNKVSINDARI